MRRTCSDRSPTADDADDTHDVDEKQGVSDASQADGDEAKWLMPTIAVPFAYTLHANEFTRHFMELLGGP